MTTKNTNSRVGQVNVFEVLDQNDFQDALSQLAKDLEIAPEQAYQQAHGCLEELSVQPHERYLRWVERLARFLISRSYDVDLDVNTEVINSLPSDRPVIFLWSHKSHLDSFSFMRALYESEFRPQPLSFAGINMAFAGFDRLSRNSGAIFVRRSFSDDPVYRLVFRHTIDYLAAKKLPLSWSIEGTRSRTGKLMPPKFGLLGWVIDAMQRKGQHNALIVPVSISFDQIAEMDDYINLQKGKPKRKESLAWFLGFIFGMREPYGRIYVRFANPLQLDEVPDVPLAVVGRESPPEHQQTRRLAFETCRRIENSNVLTATAVMSLCLLAVGTAACTLPQLKALASRILARSKERGLPLAPGIEHALNQDLQKTLTSLQRTRLLETDGSGSNVVFRVVPEKQIAASYYRNTIAHYFLDISIACMALAKHTEDFGLREQAANAIRDLLKFEFFFPPREDWQRALQQNWQAADDRDSVFALGILRTFLEAYGILAKQLLAEPDKVDKKELLGACMQHDGDQTTSPSTERPAMDSAYSPASITLPLFENAIRLAAHRGLLHPEPAALSGRKALMEETTQLIDTLNQLQTNFHQHMQFTNWRLTVHDGGDLTSDR